MDNQHNPVDTDKRCNAKTRNGTPCRRYPAPDRNRCKLHGGASPKGKDSPHYKTGQRTQEAIALRREVSRQLREMKVLIKELSKKQPTTA